MRFLYYIVMRFLGLQKNMRYKKTTCITMGKNARSVARIRNGNITLSYGRKAFFKCFRRIHKCIRWLKAGEELSSFFRLRIRSGLLFYLSWIFGVWILNGGVYFEIVLWMYWEKDGVCLNIQSIVNCDQSYV